jgi:hypothetical protein
VEYLLGALAGDLLIGFQAQAARSGLAVRAVEVAVSGALQNPLVHLGVVGETGSPGLEAISGTLYVDVDVDVGVGVGAGESVLDDVWRETLARSPLVSTLQRGVALNLGLRVVS